MKQPTAQEVAQLRAQTGLNQAKFGELLHSSLRSVQNWEGGQRIMPLAIWELALIKTKKVKNVRS